MTEDPEALVHYPEDVVVAPPLPRTLRDAKDISGVYFPQFSIQKDHPFIFFSGEDAVKALILLSGPQYNMPAEAEGRRERFWAYLDLFGRMVGCHYLPK